MAYIIRCDGCGLPKRARFVRFYYRPPVKWWFARTEAGEMHACSDECRLALGFEKGGFKLFWKYVDPKVVDAYAMNKRRADIERAHRRRSAISAESEDNQAEAP